MRFTLLLLITACGLQTRQVFATPCEEATHLVAEYGATVPFLDGTCTGLAKFTATCITQHATDCDSLSILAGRLDECMPDAGDDLFPSAEDLEFPVAHRDAGATP